MKTRKAEKLLTRYALGELDPATRAEVEHELAQSESCRAALQDIEPTLDLLHDALAAPTAAPERLSDDRRARILEAARAAQDAPAVAAPPPRRGALRWLLVEHPVLARAAATLLAAFVVVGLLSSLLLPSLSSSRERAMVTRDRANARLLELNDAVDRLDESVERSGPSETGTATPAEAPAVVHFSTELNSRPTPASGPASERDGRDADAEIDAVTVVGFSKVSGGRVNRALQEAQPEGGRVQDEKGDKVARRSWFGWFDREAPAAAAPAPTDAPRWRDSGIVGGADVTWEMSDQRKAGGAGGTGGGGGVAADYDHWGSREGEGRADGQAAPAGRTTVSGKAPAWAEKELKELGKGESDGDNKREESKSGALAEATRYGYDANGRRVEMEKLNITLPKPLFTGTPKTFDVPNLEGQKKGSGTLVGGNGIASAVAGLPATPAPEAPRPQAAPAPVRPPAGGEETVARHDKPADGFILRGLTTLNGTVAVADKKAQAAHEPAARQPAGHTLDAKRSGDLFDRDYAGVADDRSTVVPGASDARKARERTARETDDYGLAVDKEKAAKDASVRRDSVETRFALTTKTPMPAKPAVRGKDAVTGDRRGEPVNAEAAAPALPQQVALGKELRLGDVAGVAGQQQQAPGRESLTFTAGALVSELKPEPAPATTTAVPVQPPPPPVAAPVTTVAGVTVVTTNAAVAADLPAREPRPKAYGVNPFVAAAEQPFSTFSIDVDTAAYTLARRALLAGALPVAESVRTEEFVNFFDYGYKAPAHETFKVYVQGAPSPFGRGLYLLKLGVKGRRLGREEQRPAVLTFLVDTSGSMEKPDRMGLVRQALRTLVERLAPQDRVALIQFDSHARVLLEHTPASEKARILAALDAMQCGGSTNLEEGMQRAYALAAAAFVPGGENRVLLLSDGVANLGTVEAGDILANVERYRRQGIYCSVFGFGAGTYDDTMLETLANKGDGSYAFMDSAAEVQRVLVDDLAATLNTIAADVKIQVEFNPARVQQYRQLGYENRQLRKEDFRNDAVDAGEVGSGQSVTALYELALQGNAREPVGTVRVRYRRTDNGKVEEIEQPISPSDFVLQFKQADPRFRLAAGVAEFAEILRGSPHAQGSRCAEAAAVLRPAALGLDLDARVQELLRLVDTAGGMLAGE